MTRTQAQGPTLGARNVRGVFPAGRARAWRALPALVLGLALLGAGAARAEVSLAFVATFVDPTYVTHAGDADRLFVVEQAGRIRIYSRAARRILPRAFLDIDAKVLSGGERGLLSLAFHPDYARNGFFFVNYTDNRGRTVIERYRVSAGNPNRADAASGKILLRIDQPFANHNGGQLQIGPRDGYLYIGMGDGGSANDPMCFAQRRDSLLGKLLRLDVRQNLNRAPYHGIPAGNPFVTDPAISDSVWALGLRNPWRFSFDRVSGDLYIADVGQSSREEVDLEPAGSKGGLNWGWDPMEGTQCGAASGGCPDYVPTCGSPTLVSPIHEYDHSGGECSITGGYVYRGSHAPELAGRYVFGDFCSGRIRALRETEGGFVADFVLGVGSGLRSFGEDAAGNVYVVQGNRVSELVSTQPPAPQPRPARSE